MGNNESSTTFKSKNIIDSPRQNDARMVQNILLIWLDNNMNKNTADCQHTITQLRRTVNSIYTFTNEKECIDFLENINNDNVCLIISGSLGQQIVPKIHGLVQVDTIFIFCNNKQFHEIWVKNWSKIKGIFTEIKPICEALRKTAQQCEQNSISMSFVNTSVSTSKDQIEPSFMYTTILKEILLTIEFEEQHIRDYINYCRSVFADNYLELENIRKFEQERAQKSPIWWYTYECFLYPMLNRGLRLLDGDIITKMGFFIADLHRQIEQLHKEQFPIDQSNSQFIVYRGQVITRVEFVKLRQTQGGLISFNNFLSTSKKREVSLRFARNGATNPDNVGILFVMTIQPDESTVPFASIAHISFFGPHEDEVLFAMHSVFRINDIQPMRDNPGVFKVDLILTNDNDEDLQKLTDQIREESFPNSYGWYRLGEVLGKMAQFEKAQQVYEMLLEQETGDSIKAPIYHQLGLIKRQQGEYIEAIRFYEKDLEISRKLLPPYHPDLAISYNNIGNVYHNIGQYTHALFNYEKALTIQLQSLPTNHPDLAASYNNIGMVYDSMGEYAKALYNYEKSLAIKKQSLPPNHPNLACTYANLGLMYENMKNYSKARSMCEKAFVIAQKSLPENHPDLKKHKAFLDRITNKI